MMSQFRDKLEEGWRHHNWLTRMLLPVSLLYRCGMSVRTGMYRMGLLRSRQVAVPVVVVGNLTVGGTGKTPLVIHLAGLLERAGWNPGIISRGYLGRADNWPREVQPDSDPAEVGDEAVVLASRCACPVVVGPSRLADADMLLESGTVDIVLSDDGLQHYALQRQIEIAIVPEESASSNRSMLPAGPYRETAGRLEKVDVVLQRGAGGMELRLGEPVSVDGSEAAFVPRGPVHAVAGIARPSTFFELLRERGLGRDRARFSGPPPF